MAHRVFPRALTAWLAVAGCGVPLAAAGTESIARREQPYHVTRWTTDQGLPQNRISGLKQTRDGYLWLGTWFGLVRFNGARFTGFDKFNTPELMDDTLTALAEDGEGTLWIATLGGMVSYRGHEFRRVTPVVGSPRQRVLRLLASPAGGLWLQVGKDSVLRFEAGKLSRLGQLPASSSNSISALREDPDGSLQIVTQPAWLTWSPATGIMRTNPVMPAPNTDWQAALAARQSGCVWVGTREGLQRYDLAGSRILAADPLGPGLVDYLYEDHATNLWVNVQPGRLFRQDRDRWMPVDLGNHAGPVATICMEADAKGNLWLGTDQGLIQLQTRQVRVYTARDGLAGDQVWSVCEGTDGTIWVGTQSGLSRIQDGAVAAPGAINFFGEDSTRCVWPARAGGVRIATRYSGV